MKKKWIPYIVPTFVVFISLIVILNRYDKPSALFWDENYFIAAAYKYLNGVFFMEPHPPLGKLFIAAGEYILHPNTHLDTSSFLVTDYIKSVPPGFSFTGVRLFPVLFGALSSVFFYLILLILSKNILIAFALSTLYIFDNAIVLQSRGAMLDSTQLFFVLGGIWWFVRMIENKHNSVINYLILGLWIGFSLSVKLNSWFMGILPFIVFLHEFVHTKEILLKKISAGIDKIGMSFFISFFILVSVYCMHIFLGRRVINGNYYQASVAYKRILDMSKTREIQSIPIALRDHLLFIPHYEKGVPAFDVCKSDENGSMAYTWPFLNKTINYRWETKDGRTQYLYLIGNPLGWFLGLLGLVASFVLITAHYLFSLPIRDKRLFSYLQLFFFLYCIYILSVLLLPRVMYLYHYFIPLLFSFFLFCLIFLYIFIQKKQTVSFRATIILISIGVVVFVFFLFFSPFTYYIPLSKYEFQLRNWFSWWGMKSIY